MYPFEMYVRSDFVPIVERPNTRKRKGADGRPMNVECPAPPVESYCGSTVCNGSSVVDVWSPDHDISAMEITVGGRAQTLYSTVCEGH